MHIKSNNLEIMIHDIKLGWKHQRMVVILSLTVLVFCITNVIK